MRSQTDAPMMGLAILFAVGLAVAVALICISYIKNEPADPLPPETSFPTLPVDVESTEGWTSEAPAPTPASLLQFSSNGDGTCVLSGLGDHPGGSVVIPDFAPNGERVTAIAPMALYGAESVTAVQIPASVMHLGALSLAACPNLVYVSVAPENAFFCDRDGVLYSADLSTLLLYPARRAGSSLAISSVTTHISEMAFYRCAYLVRIEYEGSAAEWEQIRIGSRNYSLTAAAKDFLTEDE